MPDLSRIVSLIMENPKLIEEISALTKKEESASSSDEEKSEPTVAPAPNISEPIIRNTKRSQLLSAIKPYVSGKRAEAIDSMISIVDMIDMMKAR